MKQNLLINDPEEILTVQRRVSIIFSAMGVFITLLNIIISHFFYARPFPEALISQSVYLTMIMSIPFIVFMFIKKVNLFVQFFQIFVISIAMVITLFQSYNGIYGLLFCILALALLIKYNLFRNRLVFKVICIYIVLIFIIEFSAFREGRGGAGTEVVIFLTFFLFVFYLIFKSDFARFLHSEKRMKNEILDLLVDRDELRAQIEQKQQEYEKIEKKYMEFKGKKTPFDFAKYNLTPSEINVIKILVKDRASNKDISEKLNIKESTVKQHLYRIFNKIGIDNRIQLIDLCEYNF